MRLTSVSARRSKTACSLRLSFMSRCFVREAELTDAYVRGELSHRRAQSGSRKVFMLLATAASASSSHKASQIPPHSCREKNPQSQTQPLRHGVDPQPRLACIAFRSSDRLRATRLAAAVLMVIGVGVWFAVERMRARVEPQRAGTNGAPSPGPKQDDSGVASRQPDQGTPSPGSDNATPGVSQTPAREDQATRPAFATITLVPGSLRDEARRREPLHSARFNPLAPPPATRRRQLPQLQRSPKYTRRPQGLGRRCAQRS